MEVTEGFTGGHNIGFEDLTLEEQDMIMMLRRLEATHGEENVQTMVFLGDEKDAEMVRNFALNTSKLSRDDSYEGEIVYIIQKVPTESLEMWEKGRRVMHKSVDRTCGWVLDIAEKKALVVDGEPDEVG